MIECLAEETKNESAACSHEYRRRCRIDDALFHLWLPLGWTSDWRGSSEDSGLETLSAWLALCGNDMLSGSFDNGFNCIFTCCSRCHCVLDIIGGKDLNPETWRRQMETVWCSLNSVDFQQCQLPPVRPIPLDSGATQPSLAKPQFQVFHA